MEKEALSVSVDVDVFEMKLLRDSILRIDTDSSSLLPH
jgi:hypothetical protein